MTTLRYTRAKRHKTIVEQRIASQEFSAELENSTSPTNSLQEAEQKLLQELEADYDRISHAIETNLSDALDAHSHIGKIKNTVLAEKLHQQTNQVMNTLIAGELDSLDKLLRRVPADEEDIKNSIANYRNVVVETISTKPKPSLSTIETLKLVSGGG